MIDSTELCWALREGPRRRKRKRAERIALIKALAIMAGIAILCFGLSGCDEARVTRQPEVRIMRMVDQDAEQRMLRLEQRIENAYRKVDRLADALEAVARGCCPHRTRAPRLLDEARAIK